ncbi:energy transducer TonB [Archangium lansingense]|uniref:energy transducer TonB n=1 Tax=Archangium lansingense TaxID=2995310 RepID=UPI003B76DEC6
MRRSRLLQALILSLALHLGLGLLLYLAPPTKREPSSDTGQEPLHFEVVERTPPPRVDPPPPPVPAEPVRPPRGTPRPPRTAPPPAPPPPSATAAAPPPAATPSAPPPAEAEAKADEPEVPDVPHQVRLFPGPEGLAVGPSTGATPGAPTGRTWRPGDGPTPGQLLAEEGKRVQGRVQGFLDDGMASLRVQNGLIDTYFGEMDRALEKGLTGAPLFAYQGVFKHFFKATPGRMQGLRDLISSAGRYGATGNPDAMGEPTGTDRLEDVARSGTAGTRARSRPSNVDMLETYSKAAGGLLVTLELEQSRTGQVLSVKLLDSSGNPLFDAYVVERVPKSLEVLGPASEHFAVRSKGNVRSVWRINGNVSFSRTIRFSKLDELGADDAAYISALIPFGLLSGNFEETRGEVIIPDLRRPHFDIRTQLLRVY